MASLFSRGSSLHFRVIAWLLLAILLMAVDHRTRWLVRTRNILTMTTAPVHYLVDFPFEVTQWIASRFTSQQQLVRNRDQLRAENLVLHARLQQLLALERENHQLRSLLQSSKKLPHKVIVAQILSVESDPNLHQVVINKGRRGGAFVGQAVIDARGLLGQVIKVGALTSRVLLTSDPQSAVPVIDERSQLRAITIGTGAVDHLALEHVAKTSDIRPGDVLLTSGLGQRYPAGYPVGVVTAVRHEAGMRFADVAVRPSALLNRGRLALLVSKD